MIGDRKNKVAAILGDGHKDEAQPMDELEATASELLSAIESKDAAAVAAALRAAFAVCGAPQGEE